MMENVDLLITGGEVITASARKYANVAIKQGKIAALLEPHVALPTARRTVDANGLYVLPGAVDPHTHIGGGAKVVGSVAAAMKVCTRALAIGGTTTVMEMISPTKGLSLRAGVAEALSQRRGHMAIDFAFHPSLASVNDDVIAELEKCAEEGIPSFHASFEGARGRDPLDEGSLYRLLSLARTRRMMTIVHAEDARLNRETIREIENAGALENVSRCRPWFSETAAVQRSVFVARLTHGPIYFEHLGAGPSIDVVGSARREGFAVYGETCPHYLCFSEEIYRTPRGVEFLKSPPLRRREDAEALWNGIGTGSISSVATDESLASIVEKRRLAERLPAYEVSGGLNQIELRLAVMHNEMVVKRGMPLEKLVYLLAAAPARIFGLYPRKGTIEVGSDADLVLFDPKIRKKIKNEDLHQATDHTIFEGWEVQGFPQMTLSHGEVLVEKGTWVGSDSGGQWLERQIDASVIQGPAA
jgi:dihydropyrimidinase